MAASKSLRFILLDFLEAWISMFAAWLWALCDGYFYTYDAFISPRQKEPNPWTLGDTKTCYRGLEQDHKDGTQDSPSPDERSNNHSHEGILQMNQPGLRSWVMPPRSTSIFILDSRATSHVVSDVSLSLLSFRSRVPTTTATGSGVAATYQAHDGRVLTVAGVGTISCDNFHVPNVLCVPGLCTRLILVSVLQLAECGYLVMFGGGKCSVMEQNSGKIVGKGRLHADDGLYHLDFLDIPHDKDCEET